VPGCTASWVSSTEDEILVLVARHASKVHNLDSVSPEMARSITDRIVVVS
jgi:predicted small metal-binding protein